MRFGLFYEWPNPNLMDWKRLFEEGMEQIQYSEEMGFDFVLVAEHHFSNYGMSPAPLMQSLAIARATKRLKIATAVLVLPIWQPLRLAEEIAVLDNLSDGRFIVGIGRGYQPHEFGRFGVTVEESRERFTECLDVLVKAWTSYESFTYQGKYYNLDKETVVWPKPLQKPHPPFWIAGSSADTMKLAAERDMWPITTGFYGAQGMREAAGVWVQARRAAGLPIQGLELGAQAITNVCDTDEEARSNVRYARWQNRAGRSLAALKVKDGRVQVEPYEGEPNDEQLWDRLYYGSPERVIGKFKALADGGVTFVSNWMMAGGMEHEKIMKSIGLMGEHVIPALKDVHPPAGLPQQLLAAAIAPETLNTRGPAPSE